MLPDQAARLDPVSSPLHVVERYRRQGSSPIMEEKAEDTFLDPDDGTPLIIQQRSPGSAQNLRGCWEIDVCSSTLVKNCFYPLRNLPQLRN